MRANFSACKLPALLGNTDEAFRSVSTRKLDLGVGGLVVTVTFTRHSGYFERYYIFPMVCRRLRAWWCT